MKTKMKMKTPLPGAPEIGYVPRALVFATLPIRRVRTTTWTRRLGPSELQMFAAPEYGLPYGQDRLVLLLVCSLAVYQNSREVRLGSAFSILRQLGIPPDGRNYARLLQRLRRVFNSALIFRQQQRGSEGRQAVRSVLLCFDRVQLWAEPGAECRNARGFVNRVVLSEGFWRELRRSFVTYPMAVARALSARPANLDLMLWLAMRSGGIRPGGVAAVPLGGAGGLMRQLGLAYAQARDFRSRVRSWLEQIRSLSAGWPAELSPDGRAVLVWHREPYHAPEAREFLRSVWAARAAGRPAAGA